INSILQLIFSYFFFKPHRPPSSTLFPYTTLFRSLWRSRIDAALQAPHLFRTNRHREMEGTDLRRAAVYMAAQSSADLSRRLRPRSEEHTSELQSRGHLVCRLLLEKKK